jgi:hypothetical protein
MSRTSHRQLEHEIRRGRSSSRRQRRSNAWWREDADAPVTPSARMRRQRAHAASALHSVTIAVPDD